MLGQIHYLTGHERYNYLFFLNIWLFYQTINPYVLWEQIKLIVKFLYCSKVLPKGKCLPFHIRGFQFISQLKSRKWPTIHDSYAMIQCTFSIVHSGILLPMLIKEEKINRLSICFPSGNTMISQLVSKVYMDQTFINIALLVLSVLKTIFMLLY